MSLTTSLPPATLLAAEAPLGQRRGQMHVDFPSPGRGVNVPKKNEEREVLRTGRGANSGRTGKPSSSFRPSLVRLCNLGEVSGPFSLSFHVSSCGTPPLPSVLRATGLSAPGGRRLLFHGPYLLRPHALAVTPATPASADGHRCRQAVKPQSRTNAQALSPRALPPSSRSAPAHSPKAGAARTARPSPSVWLRPQALFPVLIGIIQTAGLE